MKYEMIFGDEMLFDGAPEDCILVVRAPDEDKISYLENNKSELRGSVSVMDDGVVNFAMRRTIKEPKRWTLEDKKAGVLPEVGSKLIYTETGDQFSFVGVIAGSMRWACKDACDGLLYFFESHEMSPIETPAEKAQREENEFVKSEMKDTTLSIEWACIYERGVRAAYRKLKAPVS